MRLHRLSTNYALLIYVIEKFPILSVGWLVKARQRQLITPQKTVSTYICASKWGQMHIPK